VIAVTPEPAAPAQPDPFVVEQAPEPAPLDTPRFDPEAARRMARSLANMRDPAKEGTAIGQFPEKPLETETRAARAIGAAKRRNCKDGIPGGTVTLDLQRALVQRVLLAPGDLRRQVGRLLHGTLGQQDLEDALRLRILLVGRRRAAPSTSTTNSPRSRCGRP
jgi:hypothetical protein